MNSVLRHLRRAALLDAGAGLRDGQLLEAFLSRRDEAAFEALVRRHGPMVLGVCRRVLGNHHDAEDAFQATFLVLARKAAGILPRGLVGSWLYGVAYRTALKARTMSARRQAREVRAGVRRATERPDPEAWDELLPLLDEELSRLPDRYRVPVVLCDLEGLTRREAARRLGVPEGTLSGRLTTAHRLLARRLARYGPAVSGGAVAAVLAANAASACVPGSLASATARAAALGAAGRALSAGAVPARVMTLTEGVVKTMLLTRLRSFGAVAFAVVVSVTAVGLTFQTGAAQAPPKADRSVADELEELRLEVAALRKGLDATRERVKTLEAEAQARKAPTQLQGVLLQRAEGPTGPVRWVVDPVQVGSVRLRVREPEDARAEAEAAFRRFLQNPSDKQAGDALEKALQRLKERPKTDGGKKE